MTRPVPNLKKRRGLSNQLRKKIIKKLFRGGNVTIRRRRQMGRLMKYGGMMIRLLSAYWDLAGEYPRMQTFYDTLLGNVLPNLDLSQKEDREKALDYVWDHGYPESALEIFCELQSFFGPIVIDVLEIFLTTSVCGDVWKNDDTASVVFEFRRGLGYFVAPGHSIVMMLDPKSLVEVNFIMVEHNDGQWFEMHIDEITHTVARRNYTIQLRSYNGYHHEKDEPEGTEGTRVLMPSVIATLRVRWGGPYDGPDPQRKRSPKVVRTKDELPQV